MFLSTSPHSPSFVALLLLYYMCLLLALLLALLLLSVMAVVVRLLPSATITAGWAILQ